MLNSIKKAQRFLYRDFFEIELSQSSKSTMDLFAQKAIDRTKEMISEELAKYPNLGVVGLENPKKNKINFVFAVDGLSNLARALPFFSISICAYKLNDKNDIVQQSSIVSFPALGALYYAEVGLGAFLLNESSQNNSIRLKVSKHQTPFMITSENCSLYESENNKSLVRSFGSLSYSSCLLASGKVDLVTSSVLNKELFMTLSLIVSESGGFISEDENALVMTNGCCKI